MVGFGLEMLNFARWRKGIDRVKRIWNIQVRVDAVCESVQSVRQNLVSVDASICELRDKIERDAKANEEIRVSLSKQIADLRAVVANIREETKRGPAPARTVGHLRQFISSTSEEDF